MAYTTTKKQNRLLLIALVILLTAAAVLVAVTGSANKSKPNNPPLDNAETAGAVETNPPSPSEDTLGKLFPPKDSETESGKNSPKPAETAKKEDKHSAAETEASSEVSVTVADRIPEFSLPANGMVSKEYSMEIPVFSCTMNDYRTHAGVDILCETGSSVVAPADGIVGQVWEDPMMGICLNLIHSGGAVTTFKGLAPETMDFISAGTEVKKGQAVAASGQTALIECGDEPHIHMELTLNGELADPADYFPLAYLSESYED